MFSRYVISGVLNYSVYLLILFIFQEFFGIFASSIVGYVIAFLVAYILNSRWVFSNASKRLAMSEYALVVLVGAITNSLLLIFFLDAVQLSFVFAQGITSLIVVLLNFFFLRIVVENFGK